MHLLALAKLVEVEAERLVRADHGGHLRAEHRARAPQQPARGDLRLRVLLAERQVELGVGGRALRAARAQSGGEEQ